MKKQEKLWRIAAGSRLVINMALHDFGEAMEEYHDRDSYKIMVKFYFDSEEYQSESGVDENGIKYYRSNTIGNWYCDPYRAISPCFNCEEKSCEWVSNTDMQLYLDGCCIDTSFGTLTYPDETIQLVDFLPYYFWQCCGGFPNIKRVIAYNVDTGYGYSCRLFQIGRGRGFVVRHLDLYHHGELLDENGKLKEGCKPDYSDMVYKPKRINLI